MALQTIVVSNHITILKMLLEEVIKLPTGEFWECGVYNGGTAAIIADIVPKDRKIRLFDSFEGLPKECEHDNHHKQGDFNDVDYQKVVDHFANYNNVEIKKGWIPDTFSGLNDSIIAFCHLDLDLYEGHKSTLEFVWPRLVTGGIIIFDDYNTGTCQGAKLAVDEFLALHDIKLQIMHRAYWIIKT